MVTRCEIKLKCKKDLSVQMGPMFHGALMELLSVDYANELHQSKLHPYAQHLERRGDEWYWIVCCLNREASEQIVNITLKNICSLEIKKIGCRIELEEKKILSISHRELMDRFYSSDSSRYIRMQFITPSAFKQQGRYIFCPDIRCIYQSLMNKYDAAVREENMIDEDTLEELTEHTEIVSYNLKSTRYQIGEVKIPSYIGKMTVRINGSQTMADFANLLATFGTYSGVGIKSALGMGAVRLLEERGEKDDGKAN